LTEKMDINRDNYEAWLLDLIEGNLDAEQVLVLRDFLLLNPDCAVGLDEIDPWVLEGEKVSFTGKQELRRELPSPDSELTKTGFDLFSIARLEGDLTERQERDYLRLIEEDEEKLAEWLSWKELRLDSKPISFDRKNRLKKRSTSRSRVIWISFAATAAAIALFFTILTVDRGLTGPDEFIPLEAEADIESYNEPIVSEATNVDDLLAGDVSSTTEIFASKPVILSIKKHQDPPELTGIKDTAINQVQEEKLRARPLKIAMLETVSVSKSFNGQYDRIESFDLPSLYVSSGNSAPWQYSEKGLRQTYRDFVEENDISLLTIASAGIDGINFLAGSDLSLNISRDGSGGVSGFRFRSNRISVDAPVKKVE